ncbi:MAG TPA: transglutaminase domain-containing protein, partial [Gemmataceae bacterium]
MKWTVRGRHPEYGGHFFAYHTFGDPDHPTVREELRVRLPRDRPLKHAAVNAHLAGGKLGPEVTEADGQRLYRWVASNLKRVPGDPDLPPQEEFQPLVACSTFQSWEEVGEWERALRAECWECAPEMRKVVHEVTKDLKTPLEKVRALTGWVRRNIRYVSVGARHDFTPHPASRTFADRFGDCKDSSQLLAAMLREVGVPAAMVTLGFRGDGQIVEGVPSPWGTHAILLVTLDGKDHWIDPATSLAAWDFLPPEDCDRVAYAVGPAGVRVLRTPKMTPGDNRTVQETTVDVRPDGSTLQTRAAAYHGLEAWTRRHDWFEEPAGEVRRLIAEEVQEAQPGARLESYALDPGSLRDFDGPVKAWVTFENPRHFTGEEILEGSVSDGALWQPLLGPTIAFGRTVPMELPAPFESVHTFTFRAAPGTRLIDPPGDAIIVSKWGSFRRRVRAPDGPASQWRVEMRTRLERTRVEPSEFDAFRDFQDRVLAGYRVYATVRPATPEEAGQDAAKLRALYEKRPEDAETAARLARLLLTAGRAAEARDVLGRALKTHPDSLTLLELAADAADGVAGEIAAREKLFRLFPQRPSYRLDLAGALLRDGAFAKARDLLRPLAED